MAHLSDRVPLVYRQWVVGHTPPVVWRRVRPLVHGESRAHDAVRRLRTGGALRSVPLDAGQRRTTWLERPCVARVVSTLDGAAELALSLDTVAAVLDGARIPWVVLDFAPAAPRRVIVPAEDKDRFVAALSNGAGSQALYVAPVRAALAGRTIPVRQLPGDRMAHADVLRVFSLLAADRGPASCGPEFGCDVEFWKELPTSRVSDETGETLPAGTRTAPRRNRWVDVLAPGPLPSSTWPVDGRDRPVLPVATKRHVFDVSDPIDLVYTWVDGSDEDWRARFRAASDASAAVDRQPRHALAANSSRFLCHDELRYSLRSVEAHAPWVRHVFLVTADQRPDWLVDDHPRLTVVSHREIFGDRGTLPTFNSHAIESQLHHIPGLGERFLYLNDDVFFGRLVAPELFFSGNGQTMFFPSHAKLTTVPTSPGDAPVMSAGKNNRTLLEGLFGRTITNKMKHVPMPLSRPVLEELEKEFAEEFRLTASAQFRSQDDLSVTSSLHHYYAYLTGRAQPSDLRYLYADLAAAQTPERLTRLLRLRDYDTFCLNDTDSAQLPPDAQRQLVSDFLRRYFPFPSSFERA